MWIQQDTRWSFERYLGPVAGGCGDCTSKYTSLDHVAVKTTAARFWYQQATRSDRRAGGRRSSVFQVTWDAKLSEQVDWGIVILSMKLCCEGVMGPQEFGKKGSAGNYWTDNFIKSDQTTLRIWWAAS